jgi:parallel beta-helix repeat protein
MIRSLALVALLALSTSAAAQSDALTFTLGPIERIGDSDIANSFGVLHNSGPDIRNVTVNVDLHGFGKTYIGGESNADWNCKNGQTPFVLYCTTPLIRAGESKTLQIYAGPVNETRLELAAQASWENLDVVLYSPISRQRRSFGRQFIVSNTGDAGAGSLRAAIESSNVECTRDQVPCSIVFHIDAPVPERGWYTIFPNTPLPAITPLDIEIDGSTQTRFSGDTNVLGPEIELDGSALGIGHGLQLAGTGWAVVSNLAIGNFPWHGIAVTRDSFVSSRIEHNYIGTDATGTRAHPNRSRGIAFDLPASDFEVTHNIISGNARSGVFVAGGVQISLTENQIGTGTGGVAIPNGASGVFLGDDASDIILRGNTIAYNTWFGIAISQRVARYTILENSITRNGFIGIDRGLDGFSGYDLDDEDVRNATIPPPRLLSAIYDPVTNLTTITGTYHPERDHEGIWEFSLYASTVNDGQGETYLGTTSSPNNTFTFKLPGNLSGKFITATGRRYMRLGLSGDWFWTTEFSEAIEAH